MLTHRAGVIRPPLGIIFHWPLEGSPKGAIVREADYNFKYYFADRPQDPRCGWRLRYATIPTSLRGNPNDAFPSPQPAAPAGKGFGLR
jgi:hypothetical protein